MMVSQGIFIFLTLSQRRQMASHPAHNRSTVGSIPTAATFLGPRVLARRYARLLIGEARVRLPVGPRSRHAAAMTTRGYRSRATAVRSTPAWLSSRGTCLV